MKRILMAMFVSASLMSCGGGSSTPENADSVDTAVQVQDTIVSPDTTGGASVDSVTAN
jgi:hypothetical protein